jgi:hypothetical protein
VFVDDNCSMRHASKEGSRAPHSCSCGCMQVWSLLFQRLQAAKTARFVRGFLLLLAHVVVSRGPAALAASTDAVQPGIFLVILQQVSLPYFPCAFRQPMHFLCHSPPSGHGAQAEPPCRELVRRMLCGGFAQGHVPACARGRCGRPAWRR